MIRRPPRSTLSPSSAASDVYKRQLVLIVLFSGGSYYMMKTGSQPVDPNTKESQLVDIPEGSSVKSIASLLKEKDLIKNKRVFVKNVRDTGKAEKIKAGKYKLSKNMDNDKIIDKLVRGQIYQDLSLIHI